jgi:hypothetical protein
MGDMERSEYMEFWAYLFDDHTIRPIGWFDMSDWQSGFDKVMKKATKVAKENDTAIAFPLKGEYLDEYIDDLKYCMKEMDEKNEDNK